MNTLTFVLAFALLGAQSTSLDGYWWSGPGVAQWAQSGWLPIATPRLAALPGAQEVARDCADGAERLRREGGLICRAVVVRTAAGRVVTTPSQLRQLVGPVDSATKAVTLVALLQSDLLTESDRLAGHVRSVSDGWAVQVVRRNTFGCGDHLPSGTVLHVTVDGTIVEVASEVKTSGEPTRGVSCID